MYKLLTLVTLNSTAIQVSWNEPVIANGVIEKYRIKVDEVNRYEGSITKAVILGLLPYK